MLVASRPPEYRHFTVETGKTAYTFATQCMSPFSLETNALQCQAKAINLPFCLLG